MQIEDWQTARAVLQHRLAALNEEIGTYPGPITGCDAQFNHLLEERIRLNGELRRLDTTRSNRADAQALKEFMETCRFLAG